MIICEKATQTVNLHYSVLKFLSFEGMIWAGESLPLVLNSLGDLFQTQIQLVDRERGKVKGAFWERGQLHGPFEKGRIYDLSMRLEYTLPPSVHELLSDFDSIHPKSYLVGLDFSLANLMERPLQANVRLGDEVFRISVEESGERLLDTGHRIRVAREEDVCSLTVSIEGTVPFAHRHFPVLSLG